MATPDADGPETARIPDALPVLPLRDSVVFPMSVAPILIGQERSVRLVDQVLEGNHLVALVLRRDTKEEVARPSDIHRIGTAAKIHDVMRFPNGAMRLTVQGLERVRVTDIVSETPYLVGRIEVAPEKPGQGVDIEAMTETVKDLFSRIVALASELPDELATVVSSLTDPRELAYLVAQNTSFSTELRQEILELDPLVAKLKRIVVVLQHELAVRELKSKIALETRDTLSKAQREYVLREQLKTIQKELGEEDVDEADTRELRERLAALPLPDEAREEVDRELARLERIPSFSPEHSVIRTFLDWILGLPWEKRSGGEIDVARARAVLDEDHYDLEKVKERILEYLAVRKLRQERRESAARSAGPGNGAPLSSDGNGAAPSLDGKPAARPSPDDDAAREPILCFVGPPGVGKTSLGQSIARAMGRKFTRVSLGGIHDEAEIRGHRRTYIGAFPGRIIEALRRAEAQDPVFMLDEVDKIGVGFHGDPGAALLEVLDPAQNHAFVDTYLGVPFDLSKVLFICTANATDTVPPALQDRVEVISLSGYTEEEKIEIARRHILPRLLRAHGLEPGEVALEDEAIRRVLRDHTREAGVRNLERSLASVLRKAARRVVEGAKPPLPVGPEEVRAALGPPRFFDEVAVRIDRPGVATGLAWTPAGGDVLFVEATMMDAGEERFVLTGMLGDVMRESAQAALSYVRSNAARLGIDARAFEGKAVHVHVPAGAIPKDGPSAGVTITIALASLASGRIARNDVAATGEVTLRGKVLPVGGIKEKVLAAHRSGVGTVVLPRRNEGDLEDVPAEARRALRFVLVDTIEEALDAVFAPAISVLKAAA